MPAEFDLYGVYIPRLLVLMLVTLFVVIVLRRLLAWAGAYTLVWHRGLFDLARQLRHERRVACYVLELG